MSDDGFIEKGKAASVRLALLSVNDFGTEHRVLCAVLQQALCAALATLEATDDIPPEHKDDLTGWLRVGQATTARSIVGIISDNLNDMLPEEKA